MGKEKVRKEVSPLHISLVCALLKAAKRALFNKPILFPQIYLRLNSPVQSFFRNAPIPTMARVSEKALRPRQYVFHRVSGRRRALVRAGVQRVLAGERAEGAQAREAVRQHERNEAARHARGILDGKWQADAENEQLRALEGELADLEKRKRGLFEQLRKLLEGRKSDVVVDGGSNVRMR